MVGTLLGLALWFRMDWPFLLALLGVAAVGAALGAGTELVAVRQAAAPPPVVEHLGDLDPRRVLADRGGTRYYLPARLVPGLHPVGPLHDRPAAARAAAARAGADRRRHDGGGGGVDGPLPLGPRPGPSPSTRRRVPPSAASRWGWCRWSHSRSAAPSPAWRACSPAYDANLPTAWASRARCRASSPPPSAASPIRGARSSAASSSALTLQFTTAYSWTRPTPTSSSSWCCSSCSSCAPSACSGTGYGACSGPSGPSRRHARGRRPADRRRVRRGHRAAPGRTTPCRRAHGASPTGTARRWPARRPARGPGRPVDRWPWPGPTVDERVGGGDPHEHDTREVAEGQVHRALHGAGGVEGGDGGGRAPFEVAHEVARREVGPLPRLGCSPLATEAKKNWPPDDVVDEVGHLPRAAHGVGNVRWSGLTAPSTVRVLRTALSRGSALMSPVVGPAGWPSRWTNRHARGWPLSTLRLMCPWPVVSSASRIDPGPSRRRVPSPTPSTARLPR